MRFLAWVLQYCALLYAFGVCGRVLPQYVLDWLSALAGLFASVYLTSWIVEMTQENLLKKTVSPEKKAVLITGCDTGFGHALAKALDKKRFKVYACCLYSTSDGAQDLRETCSSLLQTVQMDVTDDQSVQSAKDFVAGDLGEHELWAVVNNAGVLKGFQTELTSIRDYEDCLNVNALGMVRVTLAFLPLLRKSRGRVVNLCSIAGRISCYYMGPYDMSKSAAATFSDVLTLEMKEFGVRVITVEPEFFGTAMCSRQYLDKQLDATLDSVDEEVRHQYGDAYIERAREFFLAVFLRCSPDTHLVVEALVAAVALDCPPAVFKVCRNLPMRLMSHFAERIPSELKFLILTLFSSAMGVPKPKTGINVCQRLAM